MCGNSVQVKQNSIIPVLPRPREVAGDGCILQSVPSRGWSCRCEAPTNTKQYVKYGISRERWFEHLHLDLNDTLGPASGVPESSPVDQSFPLSSASLLRFIQHLYNTAHKVAQAHTYANPCVPILRSVGETAAAVEILCALEPQASSAVVFFARVVSDSDPSPPQNALWHPRPAGPEQQVRPRVVTEILRDNASERNWICKANVHTKPRVYDVLDGPEFGSHGRGTWGAGWAAAGHLNTHLTPGTGTTLP